jgi:HEAT repeat protein
MRADALAVMAQDDAGEDVRDPAMAVLSGDAHARHVSDSAILGVVERVRDGFYAASIVGLIDAVHRARGLSPELLRSVRDRWASSSCSDVREKAILVAALIADPELPFIARMLEDPNAEVRLAVAHKLGRGMPGSDDAVDLIEQRLEIESHPDARAALLHAQAALTGESRPGARRRRP